MELLRDCIPLENKTIGKMRVSGLVVIGCLMLAISVRAQNVYDVIVAGRTIGSLKVFDEKGTDRVRF